MQHLKSLEWSPDNMLLEAMRGDDRSAFEQIYHRYWSKLYLSAYNILRNRHASEDIIQEIFVQLWIKRAVNSVDNLNNYLYTAVRFQVFKAIRDGKARHDLFEEIEHLGSNGEIENILFEKDLNKRLEESIALLPEKCKQIFILSRKEHLSIKEIASRLDLSAKTVENQITIALRKVRANMGDLLFWAAILLVDIWKR